MAKAWQQHYVMSASFRASASAPSPPSKRSLLKPPETVSSEDSYPTLIASAAQSIGIRRCRCRIVTGLSFNRNLRHQLS